MLSGILQRVDALRDPLLVMGDLNTSDRQPFYRTMRRRLGDAYRAAARGFGFTYPSHIAQRWFYLFPVVRLDYVFFSESFAATGAWNGTLVGSDHRYVVADLVLR